MVEFERRRFSAIGFVVADEFEIPRADRALVLSHVRIVPNHVRAWLAVLVENERGILHCPSEQGLQIRTVEVFPFGFLDPGHRKNGGIKIQAVDHDIAFLASGNAWAGDEEWHTHTALARRGLALVERRVVADAFALGSFHAAVVGSKEDVGVVDELVARVSRVIGGFEEGDELANIMVQRFHHGAEERVFLTLTDRPLFGIGRINAEPLGVFVEERLAAGLDGCVNEPSRVVEEERLVLVRLHELQRAFGDRVGREALGIESVGISGLVGGKALEAIHASLDSAGTSPFVGGEIKPLVQRPRESMVAV